MTDTMTDQTPASPHDDDLPHEDVRSRRHLRRNLGALGIAAAVAATAIGITVSAGGGHAKKAAGTTPAASAAPTTPTTFVQPIRTPTDAAEELYFAWQRGDHSQAARAADAHAISAMFAIKTTRAAGLAFQGCTKPANATSSCTWKRTNARLTMHVNVPAKGAPQVQGIELQ